MTPNIHIKDTDGFDKRMLVGTFKEKALEPLASPDSTVLVGGSKAGSVGGINKSVIDFGGRPAWSY